MTTNGKRINQMMNWLQHRTHSGLTNASTVIGIGIVYRYSMDSSEKQMPLFDPYNAFHPMVLRKNVGFTEWTIELERCALELVQQLGYLETHCDVPLEIAILTSDRAMELQEAFFLRDEALKLVERNRNGFVVTGLEAQRPYIIRPSLNGLLPKEFWLDIRTQDTQRWTHSEIHYALSGKDADLEDGHLGIEFRGVEYNNEKGEFRLAYRVHTAATLGCPDNLQNEDGIEDMIPDGFEYDCAGAWDGSFHADSYLTLDRRITAEEVLQHLSIDAVEVTKDWRESVRNAREALDSESQYLANQLLRERICDES